MRERPTFEEVFTKLVREPDLPLKFLVGGLLCFVPVINIFAFGYLYRFADRLRRHGDMRLPEWTDWRGLFLDGLRFTVVWLLYWVLPLLLGALVHGFFKSVGIGALAYVAFSAVFLMAPVLFASALLRLQKRADMRDLMDVGLILRMAAGDLRGFVIPCLVFLGLFALALPLYGFAVFAAFLVLVAYSSLCYRRFESRPSITL